MMRDVQCAENTAAAKQVLRQAMLRKRGDIPPEQKQAWDALLNRALQQHPWFRQADTILAYYPIGSEPDLRPALREALRQGKRVAFPRCEENTRNMAFYAVEALDALRPGLFGIPAPERAGEPLRTGLCLVPGVAFDRAGQRLGYGGGYYDVFLARGGLRTLGLCYSCLLHSALPHGAMDVAVQQVVTERFALHD